MCGREGGRRRRLGASRKLAEPPPRVLFQTFPCPTPCPCFVGSEPTWPQMPARERLVLGLRMVQVFSFHYYYLKTYLFSFSLKGRETGRFFHLLVHSPTSCSSQGRASLKPEVHSSIWVSHVAVERDFSPCCCPGCTRTGSCIGCGRIRTHMKCPSGNFTFCAKSHSPTPHTSGFNS